jgi:hypothetical protein
MRQPLRVDMRAFSCQRRHDRKSSLSKEGGYENDSSQCKADLLVTPQDLPLEATHPLSGFSLDAVATEHLAASTELDEG